MVMTILGYALIFFARIVDVSLGTIRTLMLFRGRRTTAAIIGFFEVIVFIVALKEVVDELDNIYKLLFYASGFAAGNIVGSMIEEKMAIGNFTVQVITKVEPMELASLLRKEGFGVTVLEGEGKEGPRYINHVMLKRKDFTRLLEVVDDWDPCAFMTVSDARATKGGFIRMMKK